MEIDGYQLTNTVKLDRARTIIGEDASDQDLLVAYDRLGGLITKEGQKIKTGCFYDVKSKKAFAKPKLIYLYSVSGRIVEVPEGTELPGEVRAANILAKEAKKTRTAKPKKEEVAEKEESEEGEDE